MQDRLVADVTPGGRRPRPRSDPGAVGHGRVVALWGAALVAARDRVEDWSRLARRILHSIRLSPSGADLARSFSVLQERTRSG